MLDFHLEIPGIFKTHCKIPLGILGKASPKHLCASEDVSCIAGSVCICAGEDSSTVAGSMPVCARKDVSGSIISLREGRV